MGRSPGVAFQLISAICSLLYIWHLGLNWWLCLCIWAFSFLSKFSELQETGNAGVCQSLLSLSPWDGYRITPWTRRKVWCLTLLIFRRDSWCLSTIRDPRPHKELEQPSCGGDGKHCILLSLWLINTACQSQRQRHAMTSFLGPYAMSKAVILFFLLPYLGLHTCHLPLKRAKDFLYPRNVFIVSVQIICIGIWFTHSKMALFVKLVYSSIHFEKLIPRYVLPNEDVIATSLSLKNYWCILFV